MTRFVADRPRGATLVAVLAAMAVVLAVVGGMLRIGLLGRRQLLRELDVRQAECLLEAAADRAALRLAADPEWTGDSRTVPSDEIVGHGAAEVTTRILAEENAVTIVVEVEYPAGRADSARRERAFPHQRPADGLAPSTSAPADPASPEVVQ